jgi:hypothetical protein
MALLSRVDLIGTLRELAPDGWIFDTIDGGLLFG